MIIGPKFVVTKSENLNHYAANMVLAKDQVEEHPHLWWAALNCISENILHVYCLSVSFLFKQLWNYVRMQNSDSYGSPL